jgi:hypothetical protein
MPNVTVIASSPALIGDEVQTTSAEGLYRFPALPVGTYRLSYSMQGFAKIVREGVAVQVGFADEINVSLSVATQTQEVVVSAETPLIDPENTNIQNTVSRAQLTNLANSRDIWSVMGITAGMNIQSLDVGGSAAGTQPTYTAYGYGAQSFAQTRVQLDGVNTTEGRNGAGFYWDYGALQEFTVSTAANDASMPVPGVFTNAVVKSGGNQFHGGFYYDYENPNFQGHNISAAQLHEGAGTGTRITQYQDPNGDIGGPIKHDRVWFYVSLRDQALGNTVTGFPANNPGTGPNFETHLQNITYKISTQLSKNHRISQFLQWGRKNQPYRNAASNYYADAVYNQNSFSWAGNIQYDGIITPKFFVTARIASFGYNWMNTAYAGPDGHIDYRQQELQDTNLAGGYPPYRYDRRRYQYEPTASYFLDDFLKASHQLKFGYIFEHEFYDNEQYPPLNAVLEIYNSPAGSPDFTTPYEVSIYNTPSVALDYMNHAGAYIQDQIRIKRRITLNVGARWDFYRSYEPAEKVRSDAPYAGFFYAGQPLSNGYSLPATNPTFQISAKPDVLRYPFLISPRLGVAIDVSGNQKTVVKLDWGRFYSNPAPDWGSNYINALQTATATFRWNDINKDGVFQNNEFGSVVSVSSPASVTVAPHIKDPVDDNVSGFVEHEIGNSWMVRAGIVYQYVHHNWQEINTAWTSSLYTKAYQVFDPGPDGVKGTSDDVGYQTLYGIPGTLPNITYQMQTPSGNNASYMNYEISVNKHLSSKWMVIGSFYWTNQHYLLNGIATNPDVAINNYVKDNYWTSHVSGTYHAPWGILISPIARMQQGQPMDRVVTVTGVPGASTTSSFSYVAQPYGSYHSQNIYIFDTRLEKQIHISERMQLGLFFDAFNIFNTNAEQTQSSTTGTKSVTVSGVSYTYPLFLSPVTVLSPRIFRLGVKFSF